MTVPADEKNMGTDTQIERSHNGEEIQQITEKHIAIHNETYDIAETALGTNLPKHYYRSIGFIGTVIGLCLGNISNYAGWVMPSNSLLIINNDIGPSGNITWVALAYTLGLTVGFLIVGESSILRSPSQQTTPASKTCPPSSSTSNLHTYFFQRLNNL